MFAGRLEIVVASIRYAEYRDSVQSPRESHAIWNWNARLAVAGVRAPNSKRYSTSMIELGESSAIRAAGEWLLVAVRAADARRRDR